VPSREEDLNVLWIEIEIQQLDNSIRFVGMANNPGRLIDCNSIHTEMA